ncbi:MAG: UDP-N-acetylmuramoyl-L-alanine--D-glutamate ligase [Patescibacteria group bacterium]
MAEAKSFNFVSYKFLPLKKWIIFNYEIKFVNDKSLKFSETIVLPKAPKAENLKRERLEQTLIGLHLMLGISYYKLYCPKKVEMPYKLTREQADFWTTVYKKGLGEFYYRNKLDLKNSPRFPYDTKAVVNNFRVARKNRALVGIGGGKDSIVVAELLKQHKKSFDSWVVETEKPSELIDGVVKAIGSDELKIKRQLDKKIFLAHQGSHNGHVPISAIIAFLGVLSALLYDYDEIIVGNEYSSSFGNIKYKGLEVNHQWSKSEEFEKIFSAYVNNFITPDIRYFSLLRQFYETRVVEQFAKLKKYHHLFSSCNRNFRVSRERPKTLWCGECPKCAFVFAQLAAWLPKREVIGIFGKNLLADKNLLVTYRDLSGLGKMKPFECVGTFAETQVALYLAHDKFKNDYIIKSLSLAIAKGKKQVEKILRLQPASNLLPHYRLMGLKNVLLLGYGREGQMTEKYLKKYYPEIKIGIADKARNKNYLKEQNKYEFAIKTPGLPKKMVTIPYTTATNLFFAQNKNIIIGVTGSKGKSTTASLIYKMLQAGRLSVRLVGNIGKPMLQTLVKPSRRPEIIVIELSSYQLDDIKFSPKFAVVTNLFPEHMNYHGNRDKYYEAKCNIINFQQTDDFYIYNPQDKLQARWLNNARAKTIPFAKKLSLVAKDIPLLGRHNLDNIRAAATVARMFNVSEEQIVEAVKKFKGLPHRLQRVGQYKKIEFFDDAISTTPESTIEAIKALKKVGTIFLGGEDRGYDFKNLEIALKKYKIKNVVLFPESGERILSSEKSFNVLHTKSMDEAVRFSYKNTPPGKICLLSTASPSYSLWRDFEVKGEEFSRAIKKYSKIQKTS